MKALDDLNFIKNLSKPFDGFPSIRYSISENGLLVFSIGRSGERKKKKGRFFLENLAPLSDQLVNGVWAAFALPCPDGGALLRAADRGGMIDV